MLGQSLHGRSVLDLFGGSGALVIEAASRGAGPCTVVERSLPVVHHLRSTLAALGVDGEVRNADARSVDSGQWDLVLLDPPYREDPVRWLRHAAPRCRWRLVLEHESGARLPDECGPLRLDRLRAHGRSAVAIYRWEGAPARLAKREEVAEDAGVVEGE